MKKILIKNFLPLLVPVLFCHAYLQAQSIDTSTTEGLYQYIFQNFDRARVPTGYLEEYGAPIIPMETFNGTLTDSNTIDINLWRIIYWQMQTAYLATGTNKFGPITTVNNLIDTSLLHSSAIPVPVILGIFNSVSATAFSSNELKIVNDQVEDGTNNQNPFLSNNLFASCPSVNYSRSGQPSFVFNSNLYFNNTTKTISTVSVNFGDSVGFRTVTWNSPVTANYLDTGWYKWTIKIVLNDNSVLQCYSKFYVAALTGGVVSLNNNIGNLANGKDQGLLLYKTGGVSSVSKSYTYSTNVARSFFNYIPDVVNAYISVPPTANYSGATVAIQYTSGGTSLKNPLIVVEGFDQASVAPDFGGPYEMSDFIDAIGPLNTNPFNLANQLDAVGKYDLVFVTFNNGTDDITRNAALLEYVIQQVNILKAAAGSSTQNVVLGMSMGGLVARYALADMTKKSLSTGTRLLITHDSPHEGANVPLGLQYLIEMVAGVHFFGYNISSVFPEYNESINLLNQPATKQLLLYCATGPNTYSNNTFLSGAYRTMITFGSTGPQPTYQFIATSLGSQCAHALYAPYTKLINLSTNNFLFFLPVLSYKLLLNAQAYALPSTGNTNVIASLSYQSKFKLFGFITIAKQIYSNAAVAPGTQLPVDGAPGALNNAVVGVNLPTINPTIFPVPGILNVFGYASVSFSGQPATFAFVPVASALDASPFTTAVFSQPFIDGINPNFPSKANNFIAQEAFVVSSVTAYNNSHIQFTSRNSQWMFDAMQGIANTLNCTNECPLTPAVTMTGPSTFCTTATYTIGNQANFSGVTILWSFPNGTTTIVSGQGTSTVNVSSVGNGYETPTVALTTSCGTTMFTFQNGTNNVTVGSQNSLTGTYSTSSNTYPLNTYNSVPVGSISGNFSWPNVTGITISHSGTGTWSYGSINSFDFYLASGQIMYLTFNGTGTCGAVTASRTFNQSGGGFAIVASPNPASVNMHIAISPATDSSSNGTTAQDFDTQTSTSPSTRFSLYDMNTGVLVKQWDYNEATNTNYIISLSGINTGLYVLKMTRNNKTANTKVIIR